MLLLRYEEVNIGLWFHAANTKLLMVARQATKVWTETDDSTTCLRRRIQRDSLFQ